MLLALGLRGVSFEFRYQVVKGRRRFWDVFCSASGSIVAAPSVGPSSLAVFIQGIAIADGERFSGSVFDVFPNCSPSSQYRYWRVIWCLGRVAIFEGDAQLAGLLADRSLRRTTPVFTAWRPRPAPRRPSFSPAFRKRGPRIPRC